MDIATHFFHLFYNEEPPLVEDLSLNMQFLESLSLDLQAIFLSVNVNNFPIYHKTQSFHTLYTQCFLQQIPLTFENVKQIQYALLQTIKTTQLKNLKSYILRLNTVELLSNQYARELTQFFTQSAFQAQKITREENEKEINLKTLSEELSSLFKRLVELKLDEKSYAKLQQIQLNMQNHKFSIGVTGVLSAGKSTFLNALLGKEVLGSSTIPETANLTVLKYRETDGAKVYFWNKKEWEDLINAGKYDKSLQEFVQESEKIFGERLQEFVQDQTKSQEISINELSNFTSANHESKLCNLVKEVELFTNLKFLQNGVEIVDTPGLDDPIIKREEITKSYIVNCDLLIHVMNASCVATQIDIDFILESLLEQNISRLLIVLTRIDLIGEKELNQSLEYTKTSLIAQLKKAQYDGDIDALIERIDFIPTASFLALLHKTNRAQEALDRGFSMEKTGIPSVEAYLDKMLLGENSLKQKDILYLAYRGFLKVVQGVQENIELETRILNASEQDLDKMIQDLESENKKLLEQLQVKQNELQAKQQELQDFLLSLQHFVDTSLKKEQEKLKNRIYEEAIYEYGRGNVLKKERAQEIIESGFSDCFSDLNRDYKFKLAKKVTQIFLDEQTNLKQPQIIFYAPKEQIAKSLISLQDVVPKLIASHSKSNQNELLVKLDSIFKESFAHFGDLIAQKNKEIEMKFFDYCNAIIKEQDDSFRLQIKQKEVILQNTLEQRKKAQSQEIKNALIMKQKELNTIANELHYVTQVLK